MKLIDKSILLISPEPWGSNHVSKHHYALELARRRNNVFFLDQPESTFTQKEIGPNLTVIGYKPLVRALRYMPKWLSALFIQKDIRKIERKLGLRFDIIWNFDSSRFFNLSAVINKLKICHIVDMSENIQRELLAKSSDICFCTSNYIADELRLHNKYVYKIHHGYQRHEFTVKNHLLQGNRVKVGYVGNLAIKYLDWVLILELIHLFPNIGFHFIGSYGNSNLSRRVLDTLILENLERASNVVLHGPKESKFIPFYLRQMDILLNVYKIRNTEDLKQLSNPHKIMEYLGSGKIIVSTYMDEYKDKRNLLEMVDSPEEFIAKFSEVVQNLDHFNSEQKQKERIAFAMDNTYEKQLNRIEEIITPS